MQDFGTGELSTRDKIMAGELVRGRQRVRICRCTKVGSHMTLSIKSSIDAVIMRKR